LRHKDKSSPLKQLKSKPKSKESKLRLRLKLLPKLLKTLLNWPKKKKRRDRLKF